MTVERSSWIAPPGKRLRLNERDAASTAHAPGDRTVTEATLPDLQAALFTWQNRLWAESKHSVLVVLQGIDASGKDGTISHVFRGLNPLGTRVAAFKEPTPIELSHDFLWRVHAHTPEHGEIAIFNRSHYEDVLVPRVRELAPAPIWRARYAHINAFESLLSDSGTTVVKFFLHISKEEQLVRLNERVADEHKRWKVTRSDFVTHDLWDRYQEAFEEMIEKTSTEHAPWYVVPANHKWYRNWVVSNILVETFAEINPQYPERSLGADGLPS